MENKLKTLTDLVDRAGYADIAARLKQELVSLKSDVYKIAVVGEFKTGKSTLINRIFLKEDALFTDIMEATAVPTEIRYGSQKRLRVIPYRTVSYKEINPFDANQTAEIQISEGQGTPVDIDNPSPADIKSCTSADTPEQRAALARKTARVQLFWNAPCLDGLAVFDTPGINTLNEAVIATTYRIIPESDLVLFVKNAKQLSVVETEFLSGQVFRQGITRAIVIVTCDPSAELSGEQRNRLLTSIRSQLANIGREYIPVEMVNVREPAVCPAVSETFRDRVVQETAAPDALPTADDIIAELLGKPKVRPPALSVSDDESVSVSALEDKLIRFIRENIRPARLEKASQVLQLQTHFAQMRCAAELSALNKTGDERLRMLEDLKTRETQIQREYEAMSEAFCDEFRQIQIGFVRDITSGLDQIAKTCIAGFEACGGFSDLKLRLSHADTIIRREMEELFLTASYWARQQIRQRTEHFGFKSQGLLRGWHAAISPELAINGGVLSKIPSFAVLAVDVLLVIGIGPFGTLGDILVRLVANYIPYLNKAMPAAIAGSLLKANIRNSITAQFEKIKAELPMQTEPAFTELRNMNPGVICLPKFNESSKPCQRRINHDQRPDTAAQSGNCCCQKAEGSGA